MHVEVSKGFWYDLRDFRGVDGIQGLESPFPDKNVILRFILCPDPYKPSIQCVNSLACLKITGIPMYNAGNKSRVEELKPPERGINLVYEEGDKCEKTGKSLKTIIKFPCGNIAGLSPTDNQINSMDVMKVYEGKGSQACQYFVEFSSSIYGCPLDEDRRVASNRRWITRDREIRPDSPMPPNHPPRPSQGNTHRRTPPPPPPRKV